MALAVHHSGASVNPLDYQTKNSPKGEFFVGALSLSWRLIILVKSCNTKDEIYSLMKTSRKNIGWILLIIPIPGLMATLALYAISSFVFTALAVGASSGGLMMLGTLINVLLGFLGIVFVLGIIVGMPLGLVLLMTSKPEQSAPTQQPNTRS